MEHKLSKDCWCNPTVEIVRGHEVPHHYDCNGCEEPNCPKHGWNSSSSKSSK